MAILASVISLNSYAAEGNLAAGTVGLNVSTQLPFTALATNATNPFFEITGKMVTQGNLMLLAGAGLANNSPSGGSSYTDFALTLGARKYFTNGDFAPFFGGHFQRVLAGAGGQRVGMTIIAFDAGAEYFLNKHFSFEGGVGFGFGTSAGTDYLGTANYGLSANFYF